MGTRQIVPQLTTAFLFIVFLVRGVFYTLDQFGTWWCVLVIMCFWGLSGVWYWSEMPGSVSQPWFVPSFFFLCLIFEEWWCPPSFLNSLSVYLLLLHSSFHCLIMHSEIQNEKTIRCACLCVRARDVAVHQKICIWMCCSLCTPPHVCFSVFPCGLAPPALLRFCLLFFLLLLFLYDVYSTGWAANPFVLFFFCFDWSLAA